MNASALFKSIQYCYYYATAYNRKGHGIHSPFVYQIIREVLLDNRFFYAFKDLAAAALKHHFHQQFSLKYYQLLFRFIHFYKPSSIVILSKKSHLAALYIAATNIEQPIWLMEENRAEMAHLSYNHLFKNLDCLDKIWENESEKKHCFYADFSTLDEALKSNIQSILTHQNKSICMVIANPHIHSNANTFYKFLRQSSSVTLSIDLFYISLLFFRPEQLQKEYFSVQY